MALLEMQIPSKDEFNANIQSQASNLNISDRKAADTAEFLEDFTGAVLTTMGIPSADQPSYGEYRTMLTELLEWFEGNYTGQTVVPRDVIDKFRRMT